MNKWFHKIIVNVEKSKALINTNGYALWCMVLIACIYGACSDDINGAIDSVAGKGINYVYNLFKFWYISLFIFGTLVYGVAREMKAIWNDRIFSTTRCAFLLLLCFLLCYNNQRPFAYFLFTSYKIWLLSLAGLLVAEEIIKFLLVLFAKTNHVEDVAHKFAVDNVDDTVAKESTRITLAKETIETVLNTDLTKESFAVGVIGEWGSGKTVFLHCLCNEAKDKSYVVEFKPWSCSSPDQIVDDFFKTLRKKLESNLSTLSSKIADYARSLRDVAAENISDKFSRTLISRIPISVQRKKLEGEIVKLDKPVAVFIDDLDRLSTDEIFEVFRLIRNTAAFPNLVYFVAFDRNYTVKMLSENYHDADKYIDKIFQLEIPLPYPDAGMIYSVFINDLKTMFPKREERAMLGMRYITYSDLIILTKILPNFREVRRLARIFALELLHYQSQIKNGRLEVFSVDVLWLTALMMVDYKTYGRLFYKMEDFFENSDCKVTETLKLKKLDDIDPQLGNSVYLILQQLFVEKNRFSNGYSMRIKGNYNNYFYIGYSSDFVTNIDFMDILSQPDNIEEILKTKYSKRSNESFFMCFNDYVFLNHDLETNEGYFKTFWLWINILRPSNAHELILSKFWKDSVPEEQCDQLESTIDRIVQADIKDLSTQGDFEYYATLLSNCYEIRYYYDEDEGQVSNYLIDETMLFNWLDMLFIRYLTLFNPDAFDILNSKSPLYQVYQKGIVALDISDDENFYDHLFYNDLISYFSKQEHKSSKLKEAKARFNGYDARGFFQPELVEDARHDKVYLFGGEEQYKEYLQKCFISEDTEFVIH